MIRDARYLFQHFSNLKNVNASTGMLETVIGEKQVPLSPGAQLERTRSRSPVPTSPASTNSPPIHHAQSSTPSLAANAASTMESANERLRGIFRRSSTFMSSDTKATTNSKPTAEEKQGTPFFPEKSLVQEPTLPPRSPPPPPTPEKLGIDIDASMMMRPSSPRSPLSAGGQPERSPRIMEKALPIPVPTLDSNGNLADSPEQPMRSLSPSMENGFGNSDVHTDGTVSPET